MNDHSNRWKAMGDWTSTALRNARFASTGAVSRGIGLLGLGLIAIVFTMTSAASVEPKSSSSSSRWESAIAAMEKADRESPPKKNGIVFVGSSTIRLWKLGTFFPTLPTVNRGFGGSQMADSVHFADRIIVPHTPHTVVIYAGDNDIAAGKSPEQVRDDYCALVEILGAKLPKTRIVFISIKPSLARWKLIEPMRRANALIKVSIDKDDRLVYVDIDKPMLGNDGKPRPLLFLKDGLHLSPAGYSLWTQRLRPHLARIFHEQTATDR